MKKKKNYVGNPASDGAAAADIKTPARRNVIRMKRRTGLWGSWADSVHETMSAAVEEPFKKKTASYQI